MGVLDLTNGYSDIKTFLEKQEDLGDDLLALKRVAENWMSNSPLDVGESGTIYRFVKFHDWKNKITRTIIKRGTLESRSICDNPRIINYTLQKLLELDNKTTQWATMAYLLGDRRKVSNPPVKLGVTYEAVKDWETARKDKNCWQSRDDKTLENQARAFVNLMKTGIISFKPEQAEDYCFARVFGLMTSEKIEEIFPSLRGHETDRIEEMETAIQEADKKGYVSSRDHRIVQAIAMRMSYMGDKVAFENPNCVSKSWPKFWDFMDYCKKK